VPAGQAPLPPEIAQQASPEQAQSIFAQQGVDQPQQQQQPGVQLIQQVGQQLQKLEQWLQETMGVVKQLNPNFQAFLGPIAAAAQELGKAVQEISKRSGIGRGSPEVPEQPKQNPASGPPNPNAV
jgi:hypothetical protein